MPYMIELNCKIICCNCNHEMYFAQIYDQDYLNKLVCSECGNLYLVFKETIQNVEVPEVETISETIEQLNENIKMERENVECNVEQCNAS